MAKDPAFLFYPGDWLGGTMTFSRSHKGAYMDLLMCQFNQGHMAIEDIRIILGEKDFGDMWESKLKAKFKEDGDSKYYNQKLEDEIIRRRKYTESRHKNLSGAQLHMDVDINNHTVSHMGDHMENENENENKSKYGAKRKKPIVNFKAQPEELMLKRVNEGISKLANKDGSQDNSSET